jgi:hypothetical protein
MSFIDSIVDFGKSAFGFLTGNTTGGALARSALLGLGLNYLKSTNKENDSATAQETRQDFGVREQVDPDTESPIPVVYGQAYIGGYVTDAVLTNSNQTMWYCLTLCEKTGTLLSTGSDSEIKFQEIFWNGSRIEFNSDGVTARALVDEDGNRSDDINGLVKVYVYNNGSTSPTNITGYSQGNTANAYDVFPNWTSNHTMNELVFALVRVDYNSTKSVTGLGTMQFRLQNSMKLPGDVLNDYLTNTRYGAGIAAEDIAQ